MRQQCNHLVQRLRFLTQLRFQLHPRKSTPKLRHQHVLVHGLAAAEAGTRAVLLVGADVCVDQLALRRSRATWDFYRARNQFFENAIAQTAQRSLMPGNF